MGKILIGSTAVLAALCFIIGWQYLSLHEDYTTEKNNNTLLKAANAEIEEKYNDANKISRDYQDRLSGVNSMLAARRVRDNQSSDCVVIYTGERGLDATASGKVIPSGDGRSGLSIDWLYDFAGRCEGTRQKTISLQNFIREVND